MRAMCEAAFEGASLDMAKPSQHVFIYSFGDFVVHLKRNAHGFVMLKKRSKYLKLRYKRKYIEIYEIYEIMRYKRKYIFP